MLQVMDYTHVSFWAKNAVAGNVELISIPGGTHDGLVHTHKQEALEKLAADIATAAASTL
jgi:alpha-beta hydrolase superfamily lysophospholipase